jgi:hypothetical protein
MQLGHKASPRYTHRTCLMHHTHCTSLLYAMTLFLILPPPISYNASFLPVHNLYHYHYFLTYLLHGAESESLEKLTRFKLVKKFPKFYGTWRFSTAFTSVHHLSLSWACSIQSIPSHPTSWRSILVLFFHLCWGFPIGLFPSGFPTKTCMRLPLTDMHYMPCPSHSSWFYHLKNTGWEYISLSSSLRSFLHSRYVVPLRP